MITVPMMKYAILIAALFIIGLIGWKWHNDTVDSAVRQSIARIEGERDALRQQLIEANIKGIQLQKTSDSAIAMIHAQDTVLVRKKYDKKIDNIHRLGTDAIIRELSKRLPK